MKKKRAIPDGIAGLVLPAWCSERHREVKANNKRVLPLLGLGIGESGKVMLCTHEADAIIMPRGKIKKGGVSMVLLALHKLTDSLIVDSTKQGRHQWSVIYR